MRTIVFKLGTASRAELRDFLHSHLNFEFNDIAWLDSDSAPRDRVAVRFWHDLHALRALVLWSMYRRRPRRSRADPLTPRRPTDRAASSTRTDRSRTFGLADLDDA